MGADDTDFNPGFNFDFSGLSQPTQAAWEFSGALREAKAELALNTKHKTTSIDHKIQNRLDEKAATKQQRAASKARAASAKAHAKPSIADDDDSDGDDEDDEDEDKPLPGEIDEDDDDDGSVMDEDEGESEGDVGAYVNEDTDGDDDEEGEEPEDEEDEEEEEEEDQAPVAVAVTRTANGIKSSPAVAPAQPAKATTTQPGAKQGRTAQQAVDAGGGDGDDGGADEAAQRQQRGASTSGRGQQQQQQQGQQQGQGQSGFFARLPDGTSFKAGSFGDLNLSRPLTRACAALGYATPTPIQAAVIPLALAGRDICGSAVTGSGKTAAFALPCLERLLHRQRHIAATYVLVLTPTRELAVQIHSMTTNLAQFTDVSVALVVGGLSVSVQSSVLRRSPEVVVATPGRLIDHLRNTQSVGLEDLAVLVLDEADRLLEMGFKDEIAEIVKMTPRKRQTMLFSATFNEEVRKLMALSLKQPVRLAADAASAIPRDLRQEVVRLKGANAAGKEAALLALCARSFRSGHAIVFFRTKQRAHRAKILFGLLGLPPAAELHGDMTQAARLESLEAFRAGQVAFLLATDVAARGLDIPGVQAVINYDAPKKLETHLHRIGRTARAGAAGLAVTFVEDQDRALLKEVVKKTKATITQRLVPPAAVAAWQAKIEGSANDFVQVIAEEREEREMRRAEMEANKTQNMLDHADEIRARPARTWFQSERQKRDAAKAAAREAAGDEEDEEQGPSKAQAKQDAKNKKREKRKLEAGAANGGPAKRKDILQEETGEFTRAIKGAKSKLRALKEQGLSASKAARVVASQAAGVKGKKTKPKRKEANGGGEGLFSGDGTGRDGGKTRDGGAARAGKQSRSREGMSKVELARVKRGGVGKAKFKSKAKYKRK